MALSDEEILAEANVSDLAWARGFKQGLAMGKKAAATPSSNRGWGSVPRTVPDDQHP